jgi:hypothetical protein
MTSTWIQACVSYLLAHNVSAFNGPIYYRKQPRSTSYSYRSYRTEYVATVLFFFEYAK